MASYSTSFAGTENPISEGGAWDDGISGVNNYSGGIQTGGGVAYSVSLGASAMARLVSPAIGANQRITATLSNWSNESAGYIVARIQGASDPSAYTFVAEWETPGAYILYDQDDAASTWTQLGSPYGTATPGDVMLIEANGTSIITKINGTTAQSVTDGSWTSGLPGIGMYVHFSLGNVSFSDWAAEDIVSVGLPFFMQRDIMHGRLGQLTGVLQ